MNKIKVIIKRPDEQYGHVTAISDRLENLQKTVEGKIKTVPISEDAIMICNEEGKILDMPHNFLWGLTYPDSIRGTVIVAGVEGEDITDVPFGLNFWKQLLAEWGN